MTDTPTGDYQPSRPLSMAGSEGFKINWIAKINLTFLKNIKIILHQSKHAILPDI